MPRETLSTERLTLRRFRATDDVAFQALAGDWEVSRMTSDIPHPLSLADARHWLEPAAGESRFAIEREGRLIGGAGYFRRASGVAEVGFWLGRAYWRQGYATEAVAALLRHGFADASQQAFSSSHFIDNPASERVLAKLGFEPAGTGHIWSVARGEDVAARYYWLSRDRASEVLGLDPVPGRTGRLSQLLSRLSGSA